MVIQGPALEVRHPDAGFFPGELGASSVYNLIQDTHDGFAVGAC